MIGLPGRIHPPGTFEPGPDRRDEEAHRVRVLALSKITSILVASLAIGLVISTALLGMESLTDYALLHLEMPGINAAYFFWGAISSSVFMGLIVAWIVNAIVYAVPAFVVLSVLEVVRQIAAR